MLCILVSFSLFPLECMHRFLYVCFWLFAIVTVLFVVFVACFVLTVLDMGSSVQNTFPLTLRVLKFPDFPSTISGTVSCRLYPLLYCLKSWGWRRGCLHQNKVQSLLGDPRLWSVWYLVLGLTPLTHGFPTPQAWFCYPSSAQLSKTERTTAVPASPEVL